MYIFRHLTGATMLAVLCLPLPVLAQTPATPQATPSAPTDTTTEVTIVGKKALPSADPKEIMISPNTARSCAFMDEHNPYQDDVMLDYLQSFGHLESEYNDGTGRFRESSPFGDISRAPGFSSTADTTNSEFLGDTASSAASACGPADRAFAAGRNFIQRNDTSLRDAFAAFDAEDYPTALMLFKAAWDKIGYQNAAFMLGKMHLMGMGTEKNTPEAIKWFRTVANIPFNPQKDRHRFDPEDPDYMDVRADAITTLARLYMAGHDAPKDPAEARKLYQKAQDIGYVPAANIVGNMYETGYGGPRDMKRAFNAYKTAAEQGFGPAQYNLGRLYELGEGVTADPKLASAWYFEAAKTGHTEGLYETAYRYDLGEDGLPHDPEKALVYYKEAAIKGQPDALNAIGASFYSGEGLEKDHAAARKWFEQAALRGQPDAMFNLGVMLMNGEGGDRDNAMAYVWFNLAKQSGNDNADAAIKVVERKLTAEDHARATALLTPS